MRSINHLECMAGTTGLEPATSAVTGQHSNQLNYVPFAIEAYRRALRSAFVASVRYSLRSERTTELSPFRSLDCSKTECAQGTEFRVQKSDDPGRSVQGAESGGVDRIAWVHRLESS